MFNPFLTNFRCVVCGATYAPDTVTYTCPACGSIGVLDADYDFAALSAALKRETFTQRRDQTMWAYRELLPLAIDMPRPPLPVGGTPLIHAVRLAETAEVRDVWI